MGRPRKGVQGQDGSGEASGSGVRKRIPRAGKRAKGDNSQACKACSCNEAWVDPDRVIFRDNGEDLFSLEEFVKGVVERLDEIEVRLKRITGENTSGL